MDLGDTLTLAEQHTLFLALLREVKEINEKQTTLITIVQDQQTILQRQQRYIEALFSTVTSLVTDARCGPALRTSNL